MDLFPDGGFVRLRSRANRGYVHADEDWVGISVRPLCRAQSPLAAVWRVQHWANDEGVVFLLLQGAAHGRYLGLSPDPAPPGHLGRRVVQRDRHEDEASLAEAFMWRADRVDEGQDYVRLRNGNRNLRANGRYRVWNNGVTADFNEARRLTTMMQWTVQAVAVSPTPLPIPAPPRHPVYQQVILHREHPHPHRTIRYMRANDEGHFIEDHHEWPSFTFHGNSLFNLTTRVGMHQEVFNGDVSSITLCVRAGMHGRLLPLVTNLPHSEEPMNIVVLTTGSPAAEALVYPRI